MMEIIIKVENFWEGKFSLIILILDDAWKMSYYIFAQDYKIMLWNVYRIRTRGNKTFERKFHTHSITQFNNLKTYASHKIL